MISFVLQVATAFLIAIGGGTLSLLYVLDRDVSPVSVRVGAWSALTADVGGTPYSRARAARQAALPLGPAEGIAFSATADSDGRSLTSNCRYVVAGTVPPNRFWTLEATPGERSARFGAQAAITSLDLLRDEANDFAVTISTTPAPGNWLMAPDAASWRLVLTLYDTSIAASAGVTDVVLPRIVRSDCRG